MRRIQKEINQVTALEELHPVLVGEISTYKTLHKTYKVGCSVSQKSWRGGDGLPTRAQESKGGGCSHAEMRKPQISQF